MEQRLNEVHRYWFGDSASDLEVIQQKGKLWFGKDAVVDAFIRAQFGDLVAQASARQIDCTGFSPALRLTVILLLDQFTRNIYRNDPRSFAADPLAREMTSGLISAGGKSLRPIEKTFLYLPLQHSEKITDQKSSVTLYQSLLETVSESLQASFTGFYDYAVRHHDIIVRFGRFPHRNKILGRVSTPAERDFLTQPGSSF